MKMSDNPAKYEVLIEQYLRSILGIRYKIYSVLSAIFWYFWYVVILKSHKMILVNFRLRRMKAEFLNMPELAQCCSLADIVPPFQV